MKEVEVQPCYYFTCPDCEVDNLVYPIKASDIMSKEEEQELLEDLGIQPWDQGCLETTPATVRCRECKQRFRSVDVRAESDNDEEE